MDQSLKDKLFKALFIESKLYDDVSTEFNIDRNEISQFYNNYIEQNKKQIEEFRRIRQLFNNKCGNSNFNFKDFNDFYTWYIDQLKTQKGKCHYCGSDEQEIAFLFRNPPNVPCFTGKRANNRGQHFEVERKDPYLNNNEYSRKNCVLSCYFCNNDKSDVISENDYFEYLKNRSEFIHKKFVQIKK